MKTKSFFKFEITQTTKVLLYKIQNGDGRRWEIKKTDDPQVILLQEIGRPENVTTIRVLDGVLHITTVRGYVYVIEDKKGDGARVSFSGPVNALLTQSLMPRMTYVAQTLMGMSDDMEDFVSIAEFMEHREKRHNGVVNPQDQHGWRVNMKFYNELIPWLPPFDGDMRDNSQKKKSGKFARRG